MLESIPVVSEFSEVFPTDLPGLPPDPDIDFCIDGGDRHSAYFHSSLSYGTG